MEISLTNVVLNSISSFFDLSSHDNITHEPALKYYRKVEEILKLLKPVLDAVFDAGIASEELLQKAFAELGHSVSELKELFGNLHPLTSKIYFVVQVETLISKIQASVVGIFEWLKSFDGLPLELDASSLEKIKQIGLEQTSAIISQAISEQVDGSGPSSESLAKFEDHLSLRSNQELLIEAVALEKLKENAEQAEENREADYFDQMIALVTHMHEGLVKVKQSESSNPIPAPADFCCPLSLELMTDPVIVASGQTYERGFIKNWIDLGLTVCPKTRQTMAHTNLIPNYTVKALIANWCETNNVKLPDPTRAINFNHPSSTVYDEKIASKDAYILPHSRSSKPESTRANGSPGNNLISSGGVHCKGTSSSHPHTSAEGSLPTLPVIAGNGHAFNSGEQSVASSQDSVSSSRTEVCSAGGDNEQLAQCHYRSASVSSMLSGANISQGMLDNGNEVSSQVTAYNSDTSGELTSLEQQVTTTTTTSTSTSPKREPKFPRRLETRSRSQTMWRRPSNGFVPKIVLSSAIEPRADLSGVEAQVRNLVEDLKGTSFEVKRTATAELRLLAKHNTDNRIVIAKSGAIDLLVDLLRSTDVKIQEESVTALLNLSINDNNKTAIANANAIEPLIHVLETGTPEAKENSAATLFSLSVIEDNKIRIGRSGAIKPLVELLGNGSPRGKKDASTALFNLSIFHENKPRIVEAGAVKYLVELMDPAAGMVDKAVAVLANLATIPEGRTAIGQEGGIPVLVEVVELGSTRGKEHAAAALLQLCITSNKFCSVVLKEGAVPPLVALSQTGTSRAKEKAQALLSCFRNQRQGNNAGRG
ncbi:U-box domain-containing protein 4-like isoform X2 [Rhododendron vialii]|uniref:U-box domain-containing protein 4-like isoform X2 n=1 Tax=Rhododendron vialii TaxID=182163 RepID=UPI00265E0F0A|nr:U-box domain-containing protein 4-like isoform X2 [Rhododendron vialii]